MVAASCNKATDTNKVSPTTVAHATQRSVAEHTITKATADSLIGSYQLSVSGNTQAVKSWDVTDMSDFSFNPSVTSVRAYLAHTPDWAASHYGTATTTELTLVYVGFDINGYAVEFDEHFCGCPDRCTLCDELKVNANGTFTAKPE